MQAIEWAFVGLALSPMISGIGWALVAPVILSRLIQSSEIDRLADATMARHPDDPEDAAFIEEHAAWCRSKSVDQGKWRRVRHAIGRRIA